MQIVKDGIEKDTGNYTLLKSRGGVEGNPERTVGIRYKKFVWRWTYQEAEKRSVDIVDSTNYPGKLKATITLGPIAYTANTWVKVLPDTWGLTETSDDANERNDATIKLGSEYISLSIGDYLNADDLGVTFSNVTAEGTAEDGCYLQVRQNTAYAGGAECNVKAIDARNVAAWSSSYRPDTHTTKHAASVAWDLSTGSGYKNSPEIKTVIQNRFDDDHQSGDEIGLVCLQSAYGYSEIASSTNGSYAGPQLYIVYSAAVDFPTTEVIEAFTGVTDTTPPNSNWTNV